MHFTSAEGVNKSFLIYRVSNQQREAGQNDKAGQAIEKQKITARLYSLFILSGLGYLRGYGE